MLIKQFKQSHHLLQQNERINKQIRVRELQLIGPEGENLGLVPLERAWALAEEKGLDLVEIGPKATPPVAKILDYGKFLYEKRKAQARTKAKAHVSEIKAVQITIGTGVHDLERKAREGSEWLREGHRVKITLFLKGRAKYLDPKFHQERLERVLHFFTEAYKVVEAPKKGPRGVTMVIEKDKHANIHEDKQIIHEAHQSNTQGETPLASSGPESL